MQTNEIKVELKDKEGRITSTILLHAKASCKRCHGRGMTGQITDAKGKRQTLLCRCVAKEWHAAMHTEEQRIARACNRSLQNPLEAAHG